MSEDVDDLFGEQLASDKPKEEQWQDGVYTVKGHSMKKGVYRAGRWEGRPFARFLYEMETAAGEKQQVSQMLPWLPGKAFFEINFKMLTGLSLSDFTAHCRSQGFNDAAAQSKFFLECFKDTEYEVEIRKSDRWFNVWEIKRRVTDASIPQPAEAKQETLVEPAEETESPDQAKAVKAAALDMGLGEAELEQLCEDEFAIPLGSLDEQSLTVLAQLLAEKARASGS